MPGLAPAQNTHAHRAYAQHLFVSLGFGNHPPNDAMLLKGDVLKKSGLDLALVLGGTLLLCLPAFWNGFPLVYSDVGAYLASAFEGRVPMGRPLGYGLFLRYTMWGHNVWLPILLQGLLFSGLVLRTIRVALPNARPVLVYAAAMLCAVLCGMNWYASQLMPDVFAGMLALVCYLLVFDAGARWPQKMGLAVLCFVFSFVHYSHAALALALVSGLFAVWVLQKLRKRPTIRLPRLAWIVVPAVFAVAHFYYVNVHNGFGFHMTRSSHVFTMARLAESGMLQDYLHTTCAEKQWGLCPYADSLPASAADFIWREDSPFKKTGYWEGSRPQYDSLISDFMGRPKFLWWYLKNCAKSGLLQLKELSVGEGLTPYNETSAPYGFFARVMPEKVPAFVASRQFVYTIGFDWERRILDGLMLVSAVLLPIGFWLRRKRMHKNLTYLVVGCVTTYVLNAFITGALANVYSRLQARVAWLIPLAILLIFFDIFLDWSNKNENIANDI
jgi:hypothetical protein